MSVNNSSTVGLLGTYPYHTLPALFFGFILFIGWLRKDGNGNPNGLPLPPGPKGYPLIGNLFDIPVDKPWVVYDEWRKTYGKIFMVCRYKYHLITGHFRRYDILQYPGPALHSFKFLGRDDRPVGEKVFKLLRQKAYDYAD
jgi:hypothetical protein